MKVKKLLLLLPIILVSGFLLSGCTTDTNLDTGTTDETAEDSVVAPTIYKQGETVTAGGLKQYISEVKKYTSKNEFMQPSDGNEFIAIMINAENVSDEVISYNALEYSLLNKSGVKYTEGFADAEPSFSSGNLQPTRKAVGYLVYEIPVGTPYNQLELEYAPISFTETIQVIWELE